MSSLAKVEVKTKSKPAKVKQNAVPEAKLKVVVRRLPPNLPEPIFWDSVSPWVNEDTCVWRTFVTGKQRKGLNKENIPSRAYIAFKAVHQLVAFSGGYDGHLFRDKQGNESEAVVEFAPFSKYPSEKKMKVDQRAGTIQEDEDYRSFIESLNRVEPVESEQNVSPVAEEPTMTPLLAALLAQKSAAKDKESITRNHAHYHTSDESAASRKRQEQKQKEKEKAQEALEFSRRSGPSDATTKPTGEKQAKTKGQGKASNSGAQSAPRPTDSNGTERKQKGTSKAPQSPTRPIKVKATQPIIVPADAPSGSEPSPLITDTQPKARPKFKFDAAVAATGGPKGKSASSSNRGEQTGGGTELQGSSSVPDQFPTQPSRKQRQKERAKERAKDEAAKAASGIPIGQEALRSPSIAAGPGSSSRGLSQHPSDMPPIVPRILLRPAARIDDDDSLLPTPSPAGIIPISPRGRGRGGGRGGGRGRGRGRGGATTGTPEQPA